MQQVRMIAPSKTSGRNPFTAVAGRTYDVAGYAVVDVEPVDSAVMTANGWLAVAPVGPTASRPRSSTPQPGAPIGLFHGMWYVDTDLGKMIVYDERRASWLDPVTGGVV